MKQKVLIGTLCTVILAGCAAQIEGTIMPMEEGKYKSIALASSKKKAYTIASNDIEVTCKDKTGGAFEVISQEVTKDSDKSNSGDKLVDAAVEVAKMGFGMSSGKEYEITTTFKCLPKPKSKFGLF